MWSRSELKSRAKEVLHLNYWKAVLVSLILIFIGGNSSSVSVSHTTSSSSGGHASSHGYIYSPEEWKYILTFTSLAFLIVIVATVFFLALSIFVFNPLIVGCYRYFILCGRKPSNMGELVFAFNHSYINVVRIMFFRGLYTFLWSLLFIIPGIIKGYEYRMIPYLLAENPEMDMEEAFSLTRQMMTGDKANTFVLDLSFIGWNLLSALTLGILSIFYVNPYQHLTNAQLYEVLLQKIAITANRESYNPYL